MAAASSSSPKSSPSPSSPIPTITIAAVSSAAAAAAAASPTRSPSPLPLPAPPPPPPSSSSRRLPPPCWSHDETLALIDSYRDKWYSLRRGNLRASHWQEVADSVHRLCHHLPSASHKTSVQCRHKIEKLRKRYRSEKQRSLSHDPSSPPFSSWVFFRKMDSMERGGAAAPSAAPVHITRPSPSPAAPPSDDDDDDDDEDEDDDGGSGNTRSLHRLMANGGSRMDGIGGLRFSIPKAVRSKIVGSSRVEERAAPTYSQNPNSSSRFFRGFSGVRPGVEEMRRRMEKKRKRRRRREMEETDGVGEMVSALRMLGDGFMRMEQMKMEMAREMEKVRMEMELKRTEMILDSQRRIVDAFVKGFLGRKRVKVSPES